MTRFKFFTLLSAFFIAQASASLGPISTLDIGNANISPDGFTRSAVLAGGTFPGPVITGKQGDSFRINVVNGLTDVTMDKTTSIHWHGLFQNGSAWADGPSMVTQCPIAPNNSFSYEFAVPNQAGTYWYHSHLLDQYCDGLRGAFVVYDPKDPYLNLYDIDNEDTIITLADWYHIPSPQEGIIPSFDSVLINGKGRYRGGPSTPLAVINVIPGKRYRFRLISISCDPNFIFSIDGHKLTIIEADGENVQPLVVDSIQIYAAQRYSFVLNANQPINNYWIRSNPASPGSLLNQGFLGGINSAILRYSGAPITDPGFKLLAPLSISPLRETDLHPLTNPAAPGRPSADGADVKIPLQIGVDPLSLKFTLNGVPFVSPTVPVLLQILSGSSDAASLLPQDSLYSLPPNKVIEITFTVGLLPTLAGAPHPFHLHGHTFSVVQSAGNPTFNYANPVRRDTVNTGFIGDQTTIRFVTDNSGPWFLHCHIDWHLTLGLAVVMVEDFPRISAAKPNIPAAWDALCPIYDNLTQFDKGHFTR